MERSISYVRLVPGDGDIPFLLEIHALPEISRFITIDRQRYFHYVTATDDVYYFKAVFEGRIVATIHAEKQENTLYLSILTLPEHQKQGFGTQILRDIASKRLVGGFSQILVSIEKDNLPSLRLFEKAGFAFRSEDDGLLEYGLSV